jgi:hypothetical protein
MRKLELILAALLVLNLGWRLRAGYARTRVEWTREAWRAFARGGVLASLPLAFALGMAAAVDLGIYEAVSASPTFRGTWVGIMFALMVVGAVLVVAMVHRFEQAAPTRDVRDLFRPVGTKDDERAA